MAHDVILQLKEIGKSFGNTRALDGVNMDIHESEIHAILGQNGAGKSTLVKILDNVHREFEGKVLYRSAEVGRKEMPELFRKKLGVVHQEFPLIPYLTVAENIYLSSLPRHKGVKNISWKLLFEQTDTLLGSLGIKVGAGERVGDLTMGERQLVTIARAVSHSPDILVFDEATSALTESEVSTIFGLLKGLLDKGVAVIYISHKIEEILNISHRVTVLRDGRSVDTRLTQDTDKAELIHMMAGKNVSEQFPPRVSYKGKKEVLLEVRGLSGVGFEDCSLQVKGGEVLGIAGLVGSGRPELVKTVFGAMQAKAGEVFVKGEKVEIKKPRDAIDRHLYFVPSDRRKEGVVGELSVRDNLTIALLEEQYCRFKRIDHRKESGVTEEFISKLSIKTRGEAQKIKELSGGNQQKVIIARWLSGKGEVFLFDEPTRGLDVGVKFDVYELLNQIKQEGKAVVMISSELPELLAMSDRIAVMYEGRIVETYENHGLEQSTVLAAMMNQHS